MIEVGLSHAELQAALRRVEWAVGDLAPLMKSIAIELGSITEENLDAEGQSGNAWPALSEVTTAIREAAGNWPGKMLQVSAAGLAASITTHADDSSALVGSNKPYAAMMHFGGDQADFPHLWGDIPARSYLPMDADGQLQPEAGASVLDLAVAHTEKVARQ
ncbi:phage virion morphogenesis protein [Stutzerimonas kirkiae]|uniref:phage virion morphogenesis protein n=1 Tax=Stutzerimonas kirkiae TaxID=2211392 RepID=UPI0010385622|nr:phage virion morphogenesis protein [Stutzerimonas kirkiae]TBV10251.1 phage virion morphogenesis protein [Stutzerimonas kirkiae]